MGEASQDWVTLYEGVHRGLIDVFTGIKKASQTCIGMLHKI
jgi:hypothetical protein